MSEETIRSKAFLKLGNRKMEINFVKNAFFSLAVFKKKIFF